MIYLVRDMIYLVEGYDLPVFWERLLSAERSLFGKISLGMVKGYDLPPLGMVEGYDLPISKNLQKIGLLHNYGGRSTSLGMKEGYDLPLFLLILLFFSFSSFFNYFSASLPLVLLLFVLSCSAPYYFSSCSSSSL